MFSECSVLGRDSFDTLNPPRGEKAPAGRVNGRVPQKCPLVLPGVVWDCQARADTARGGKMTLFLGLIPARGLIDFLASDQPGEN